MTDLEKAKIAAWDELKEIAADNFESNGRVNIEAGHLMRGWIKELEKKHMPLSKLEPVELDEEIVNTINDIEWHWGALECIKKALSLLAAQIERDILKKLEAK